MKRQSHEKKAGARYSRERAGAEEGVMNVDMSGMQVRVRLSGVLDVSGAMQLLNELDRFRTGEVIVDLSAIRDVEPFGAEVLVQELGGLDKGGARIRYVGLPPCVAERLREREIEIAGSP